MKEKIEKYKQNIDKACDTLSEVPADEEKDTDLLIAKGLRAGRELCEYVSELWAPKLPLASLADNKEDCEKIKQLLYWEDEESMKVEYIHRCVIPKVQFVNESRASDVFAILETGEMGFSVQDDENSEILQFAPIPNCLQICAFILERYKIEKI